MNHLHLRYFFEVAKSKSFTEAARLLRVSQPGISKMVRALESELDQKLIERSKKSFTLTDAGELVFQGAARIFAESKSIEESLKSRKGELTGNWSLGASDNIAIYLVPQVLGEFKSKHPKLRVSLFSGTSRQIKDEIYHERCAAGIFYTPTKPSEPFQSRQILETDFWIVISARSPWAKKRKSLIVEDLRRLEVPKIESRHADYAAGFPAHFHSNHLGLTSPPWLEVNQHEVKKRLVLEGFGFAILTRHTVESEVESGELIRIRSDRKLKSPIYTAWKKGRVLDRASEEFILRFVEKNQSTIRSR